LLILSGFCWPTAKRIYEQEVANNKLLIVNVDAEVGVGLVVSSNPMSLSKPKKPFWNIVAQIQTLYEGKTDESVELS
jgi:hypothetical protein